MAKIPTDSDSDSDSDNFERKQYSSSDSDACDTADTQALSDVEVLEVPPADLPTPRRRTYRRKDPAEDKRRKGNAGYKRTEKQIAATARMVAVRDEMNAKRKVSKVKQLMARSDELKNKVELKKKKRATEDDAVVDKLAAESPPTPPPTPPPALAPPHTPTPMPPIKKQRAPTKPRTRKPKPPALAPQPSAPALRFV